MGNDATEVRNGLVRYFINDLYVNVSNKYLKFHHGAYKALSTQEGREHHTEKSRIIDGGLKKDLLKLM